MPTRPPTQFELRVYRATTKIPRGRVTTYGLLARHIRCRSAQAIGQALSRNPFAPEVPCHRVIASDMTLGGFAGRSGGKTVARKNELLAAEGVEFRTGRLLDPERRLYRF
ncbi:MAG: MGMT family protein [Lentisphaerales bacterium]|nr:MAG: MGMT family protein [Lentisphaerales bacterium]